MRGSRVLTNPYESVDTTGRFPVPSALFQENALELVGLAGLEDREHLVARFERRVPGGDLGLPVPDDGDERGRSTPSRS